MPSSTIRIFIPVPPEPEAVMVGGVAFPPTMLFEPLKIIFNENRVKGGMYFDQLPKVRRPAGVAQPFVYTDSPLLVDTP